MLFVGDGDIREFNGLKEKSVNKVNRNFFVLDPANFGAFESGNVNIVSLNSVALLCGLSVIWIKSIKLKRNRYEDLSVITIFYLT